MTANKNEPAVSWKNLAPVLVVIGVIFLIIRFTTPAPPPPSDDGEYTFQPEPRRSKIDLGASSGALSGQPGASPVPALGTGRCQDLQDFANHEYAKRYQQGKVADLMIFRGFEGAAMSITGASTLSCSGGEFLRKGRDSTRHCKNAVLTYDTEKNVLSYNLQYAYLERGLNPDCTVTR
jgi:hypothetical protein